MTLHEAAGWDEHCNSGPWVEEARAKDTDTKWQEVRDEWIAENGLGDTALFFLNGKEFRYYLPAYLIWTLKEEMAGLPSDSNTDLVWHLGRNDSSSFERFAFMNKQQSAAVARFLELLVSMEMSADEFLAEYGFLPEGKSDAQRALDDYWGKFL